MRCSMGASFSGYVQPHSLCLLRYLFPLCCYGEHPVFFQNDTVKFKNNPIRILAKLRLFIYNVFCIIVSIVKERRMKGYLFI